MNKEPRPTYHRRLLGLISIMPFILSGCAPGPDTRTQDEVARDAYYTTYIRGPLAWQADCLIDSVYTVSDNQYSVRSDSFITSTQLTPTALVLHVQPNNHKGPALNFLNYKDSSELTPADTTTEATLTHENCLPQTVTPPPSPTVATHS